MVRVKIKLYSRKGKTLSVSTSALLNTGYGSEGAEVVLPRLLAERLGLFPQLPEGTRVEEYHSPAGRFRVYYIPEAVEVRLITEDRVEGPVVAAAVIAEEESEVLASDKLIDSLQVILVKPGEGLWRFIDENPSILRRSVPAEEWR